MNRLAVLVRRLPTAAKLAVPGALIVLIAAGVSLRLVGGEDAGHGRPDPPASPAGVDRGDPRSVAVALLEAVYRCDYGATYDLITGERGAQLPVTRDEFIATRARGDCRPRPAPTLEALLLGEPQGDFARVLVRAPSDPDGQELALVRAVNGWKVDYPTSIGDELPTRAEIERGLRDSAPRRIGDVDQARPEQVATAFAIAVAGCSPRLATALLADTRADLSGLGAGCRPQAGAVYAVWPNAPKPFGTPGAERERLEIRGLDIAGAPRRVTVVRLAGGRERWAIDPVSGQQLVVRVHGGSP